MSQALFFSLLFPLLAVAQQPSGLPGNSYSGGTDNPQDPNDDGAEGQQKGAFSLSKGALVAIIVITVVVALLGVGSATLWWVAKKRQWDVRQSLRRASRRLTGRSTTDLAGKDNRSNRRTGIRLNSPPPGKKAGSRSGREGDLEKGLSLSNKESKTTTTISSVKK